ncbi:MAG TPA: hypothetical protein VGH12_00915, partial [Steroidobacteraceae bacterium]
MHSRSFAAGGLLLYVLAAQHTLFAQSQTPSGESLFQERCVGCHNGAPEARAPAPDVLKLRSP